MNPFGELKALFGRWRILTDSETHAIRAAIWPEVAELQERKRELQAQIEFWTQKLPHGALTSGSFGVEIQRAIAELVGFEEENSAFLARQMAARLTERSELEQAGNNLRRLRHSYGRGGLSTWQSYS